MHYFLLGQSDALDIHEMISTTTTNTPSIAGPSSIWCSGGTYYISNHQLGTIESWSVTPASLVQNPTGNGG